MHRMYASNKVSDRNPRVGLAWRVKICDACCLVVAASRCKLRTLFAGRHRAAGTRAESNRNPRTETNHAQQVADELSEDQNDKGAPEASKLTMPATTSCGCRRRLQVEGQDDGGIVLSGPDSEPKRPWFWWGTRGDPWGASDDAFEDAATQFARGYAPSANCTKTTVAKHNAYQCGLAAANLLGHTWVAMPFLWGGGHHLSGVVRRHY